MFVSLILTNFYIFLINRWVMWKRGFWLKDLLLREQRRVCGKIVEEMWDYFLIWSLCTIPSFTILSSVMWASSHLKPEILNHKGCDNIICIRISNRRKLALPFGDGREIRRWVLPSACNTSLFEERLPPIHLCRTQNIQHHWQETSVASGRENIKGKISKASEYMDCCTCYSSRVLTC